MTISTIIKKARQGVIGHLPVVVLPLKAWQEIEDRLEDVEMLHSVSFRKKIAKARAEKRLYSLAQVKKLLGA